MSQTAQNPSSPTSKFTFPTPLPSDEADFTTPKKGDYVNGQVLAEHTYVEARVVGCRLSASNSGNGSPDMVDVAFECLPKQVALRAGDPALSDVAGELVISRFSTSGGAYAITLKSLQRAGYDADLAAQRYLHPTAGLVGGAADPKADVEALAFAQILRAEGADPARVAQAMGFLALQRGDLAACGLGTKTVRLTVKDDTFNNVTRRRLGFVNAVPVDATSSDVLKLVRSLPSLPAPGAQLRPPSRGQTSATPGAGEKNDDVVDF